MKIQRQLASLACALATTSLLNAQVILGSWTFETNTPPDASNVGSIPVFAASLGSGIGSGVHVSSATDWTTPTGNGSANSLGVNSWSVGDYYQFQVSSQGFEHLSLSWAQMSSASGPGTFQLKYSTDGASFFNVGPNYSLMSATWTAAGVNVASLFSRDLSAIIGLDDQPTVYLRLVNASTVAVNGGNVSSSGSNRLDNFTVTAYAVSVSPPVTAVPEASNWVAGVLGVVAGCVLARLRNHPISSEAIASEIQEPDARAT